MWGGRKVLITSFGGEYYKVLPKHAKGTLQNDLWGTTYKTPDFFFLSTECPPTSQGMFILSSMRSLEQYKAG
jgi:hypothetical protein